MVDLRPPFRRATMADARSLAALIDCAGDGIPSLLWESSAGPGEEPLHVGERRAARTGVNFSYENAIVGENQGRVSCMLLNYPLDDTDPGDLSEVPEFVRPLVRLECRAPGSWYINAIAVFPEYRGRGLGTALLAIAHALAREHGRDQTSLIVASSNERAKRLYEREGYQVVSAEPVVSYPRLHMCGEWLLMLRTAP